MGLDVYAVRSPELELTEADIRAFDEAEIELCGGIFSGSGGSFRGKIHDTLILHLTGVSLYQVWIPPEIVRQMAEALHRVDMMELERDFAEKCSWEDYPIHTIEHLRKFFDICAERGLGLAGDW